VDALLPRRGQVLLLLNIFKVFVHGLDVHLNNFDGAAQRVEGVLKPCRGSLSHFVDLAVDVVFKVGYDIL